jgi:sarcosine oxidase subunit gamma
MAYRADIARRELEGLFDLRGDSVAIAACLGMAGAVVPTRPNTAAVSGDATVFWIGPKRWLLRVPPAREVELAAVFDASLAGKTANASLVSDMYAGLTLGGPEARDVLAQGCPLDLDRPAGTATMTELFGSAALVHFQSDAPEFAIAVERSHADFIEACLRRARGDSP